MRTTSYMIALSASLSLASAACSAEPTPSGEGEASEATSENPGTETESGSETESSSETETESESGSESETGTDTEDSESTTEDDPSGTTGEEPACDGSDPEVASWLMMLDGDFPNDLPEDAEETCALLDAGPSILSIDCPSFALELDILADPAPLLPGPSDEVIVRVHHEPGWLNWPDLWIDVELPGVEHWSFTSSSVLQPTQGSYAAPWDPVLGEGSCGPFLIENMFGQDNCGEQQGYAINFEVDGAPVVAWHATHIELEVEGRSFESWMSAAREYIAPPEFCDVSPTWFYFITRRALSE